MGREAHIWYELSEVNACENGKL